MNLGGDGGRCELLQDKNKGFQVKQLLKFEFAIIKIYSKILFHIKMKTQTPKPLWNEKQRFKRISF